MSDDFGGSDGCTGNDDNSSSDYSHGFSMNFSSSHLDSMQSHSMGAQDHALKSSSVQPSSLSESSSAHSHSHVMSKVSEDITMLPYINRIDTNCDPRDRSSTKEGKDAVLEHGFSFGQRSLSYERAPSDYPEKDDEDEEEDEGIGEVYGIYKGDNAMSVESSPIFRPSPVANKRQVISKRIQNVGNMGQNIGLGHRIGVFAEDVELRPKPVKPELTEYIIEEDSPMQIDVKWSKPQNADRFKTLTYEVEMKPHSPSNEWTPVASLKFPVFRIYHTDDKLLLGKLHLPRQTYDLAYILRIRCQGEVTPQTATSYTLTSDWSTEVTLQFLGYETEHNKVQFTSL